MNSYSRKSFLLHSTFNEYKQKVKKTKMVIEEALQRGECYVSYSGGKDSTVLTHMVLQEDPNIPIWHWDYGDDLMPRPVEEEVIENLRQMGAKKIVIDKRKGSGENTRSGYKQFFRQVEANKKLYGWDTGFVGVRQEESQKRKRNYIKVFQDGDCYPLLNWTYKDVWAYILSNNIPYMSTYDKYGEVVGYDKARFVTFFDPEFQELTGGLDYILMPEHLDDKKKTIDDMEGFINLDHSTDWELYK